MQSGLRDETGFDAGAASFGRPRWLAIARDRITTDADEAALIRGAQVYAIVRLTPLAMAAASFNAVVLLVAFAALGALRPVFWVWAAALFAAVLNYLRGWPAQARDGLRPASRRAIRRVVLNGAAFGAFWGFVPAVCFAGASPAVQLFVGILTAGMMSSGAFVLAPVPLAAMAYVAVVAAGGFVGVVQQLSPGDLAIAGLLASYTVVLLVSINWNAALFVDSRLAEARVRREVAAREQAQAQALHAERMSALGELAGGIAHDVNNILQVVSGGAARIERHYEDRGEVLRQTHRIHDAVERGSAVSRRLLTFARRDALHAEPIAAAALLADLRDLLAHTTGPAVRIRIEAAETTGRLLADRRQLETVILNLAANARDAMPGGGDLTISAAGAVLEQDSTSPALRAGRYLRLAVADTGLGIDSATLARVAEPFFTTKPKGSGTGLGLSMAKAFAEQSNGAFEIVSEPGRGTTVTIWLPEAEADVAAAPDVSPDRPELPARAGAGRRVLVVDDDAEIRESLIVAFQEAGFDAMGAEDGRRALQHLDAETEVDGLVTDFSMPGLNGVDLIREALARRPGLPAILLTGHMSDPATGAFSGVQSERFALLYKPMPPARVAEHLAALMAEPGA